MEENTHILGSNYHPKRRFDPDLAEKENKRIEAEARREALEGKLKGETKKAKEPASNESVPEVVPESVSKATPALEVRIEDKYWSFSGINYRNQIVTIDLLKTPLDKGKLKSQDDWVEYSLKARTRNDFYVGEMPLYHALFRAMFLNKNSSDREKIEEARVLLKEQFNWLTNLTRIRYTPWGKDIIIHNYKMPDEYKIETDFVGPNELVKDSKTPEVYNALLGSSDIQEIDQVYSWLTRYKIWFRKKPCLFRRNNKPEEVVESIANFDSGSTFGLRCYSVYGGGTSLGVRLCVPKSSRGTS